jgi:CHRD domain-containing protein
MRNLRLRTLSLGAIALLLAVAVPSVGARDGSREAKASLDGYQETPTLSTPADGRFRARINSDSVEYTLSYENLEGTVTQAHIHLGRPAIAGGISAWLCQTATNPAPAGTNPPTCPAPGGTVSGTIKATDVIGPGTQGINPGEFGEFVRALRASATYANVHSTVRPAGEIRGRIKVDD